MDSQDFVINGYAKFLNVKDLCELVQCSRFVIDSMLKSGELPGAKIGGQWRVRADDFSKWWDRRVKDAQRSVLINCLH